MKVIKPRRLGLLHRPYLHLNRAFLSVGAFAFFPFDQPNRLLPEAAMWKLVAEELGERSLDAGFDKHRGEFLVHGSCFAPRGEPVVACAARAVLGDVDKTVDVVGDRVWHHDVPSDPVPFVEMPLSWSRAFGGTDVADNPVGVGCPAVEGAPLPNLERPGHLIRSPHDRPAPAAFGEVDPAWPPRQSRMGTYDDHWLTTYFPGFAPDIDWTAFQAAPVDQWGAERWAPGTPFVLEHLHPHAVRVEGTLPSLTVRCFVEAGAGFTEVPLRIDTVHFFPHRERAIAIYRGVVEVTEDDAHDVEHLLLGADIAAQGRARDHYEAVWRERLEPSNPAVLLQEGKLLPPLDGPAYPEEASAMPELSRDKVLRDNIFRGAQRRLDSLRADLEAQGQDVTSIEDLPPPPPTVSPDALAERLDALREEAKTQREAAERERQKALDDTKAKCAALGVDFDRMAEAAQQREHGPPSFSASDAIDKLQRAKRAADGAGVEVPSLDEKLNDPELGLKLQLVEERLRSNYRKSAHLQPPASAASEARSLEMRDDLVMRVAAGVSVEGRDYTGADLSGLSLPEADLRGGFFEGADFRRADLRFAKLDDAVLARARFEETDLEGASLRRANLGGAHLRGAKLDRTRWTKAQLAGADLTEADLSGADLVGAYVRGAQWYRANLTGVRAERLVFFDEELDGVVFDEASLVKSIWVRSTAEDATFRDSDLTSVTFFEGQLARARLERARLENLRAVRGTDLTGASFAGARMAGANLREADLAAADFDGAELEGADLSEANLAGAKFRRVRGRRARFGRAVLSGADLSGSDWREASFAHATAKGTDWSRSNLFRADLGRMTGDEATRFDEAHLERVRLIPMRSDTDG